MALQKDDLAALHRQIALIKSTGGTKFPIPITALEKLMVLVGKDVGWAPPKEAARRHPDLDRLQANVS